MSIKNIIKKWLGTQEDISHAEEKTRKEITEKLTARHKADMDQQKSAYDALEAQLNEAKATIKQMAEQSSAKEQQFNDQLLAEKDATAKRLASVGSDINHAIEDTRKQVTEQLTAERDAAVQKVVNEKDAAIAALQERMKKEEEQWQEQRKQFSDLEQQLSRYKEAGEKMKAVKSGPGRPRKDRMRYEINLDRGLKETITLLEKSGVMKHGAVSNHINEDLWEWLRPMREVLDQNQLHFEGSADDENSDSEGVYQKEGKPAGVNTAVNIPSSEVASEPEEPVVTKPSVAVPEMPISPTPLPDGLTPGQRVALTAMESGEDVFITGGAGTGKSYVVEQFVSRHDNVLLAAPTGLAARHIGGRTLHSLFKRDTGVQEPVTNLNSTQAFIDEIGPRNYKLLKTANTLIIDEISMVRQDMFDYVMSFMEAFRKFHHHIQMIVVGDFFQLAPVVTDELREIWRGFYPDNSAGYCFKSPFWNFKMIQLNEIVRQSDKDFADALNQIRLGEQSGIDWINEHSCKDLLEKGITLCPTKDEVKKINGDHLQTLGGGLTRIKTEVEAQDEVWLKSIRKDMRVEDVLEIKPKARIMILVNDKDNASDPRYHNGSMGEIVSISERNIIVKLDEGSTVSLEKNTWTTTIPEVVERKDEKGQKKNVIMQREVGHYIQFPIKLAWAATIHKSQGQTYDECNIKGNNVFGTGQIYVALSRARRIDKLHLQEPLKLETVMVSEEVKKFYGKA